MAVFTANNVSIAAQYVVDHFSNSCVHTDFVLPSILEKLDTNKLSCVASCACLPNLYTNPVPNGQITFVTNIELHAISKNCCWLSLDGRVMRKDLPTAAAWTWGSGVCGRLGDGTTVDKSSPVAVCGGFTNWCTISAGQCHTAAIQTDGTIWTWGLGVCGALGNNSTVNVSCPIKILGGFTNWNRVEVGGGCLTISLRTDGTIWTWGEGTGGKLGDGTTVNKSSPVSVIGGFTNWCAVSASIGHSAALRTDGTAWTWGCGTCGRLGDGTTVNKSSPISVIGGFTNWCAISVGACHTAALRLNGTAWTWGSGVCGRLGDSTTVDKSSPVSVIGGFTNWCKISAGYCHSAALRSTGTAWTWGIGVCGVLGVNTVVDMSSPVSVIGGFTNWCTISAGQSHSAAIRTDGTAWIWGQNNCGKFGDNTTVDKSSPVSVIGGFTNWCQIATGYHTAAIRVG